MHLSLTNASTLVLLTLDSILSVDTPNSLDIDNLRNFRKTLYFLGLLITKSHLRKLCCCFRK